MALSETLNISSGILNVALTTFKPDVGKPKETVTIEFGDSFDIVVDLEEAGLEPALNRKTLIKAINYGMMGDLELEHIDTVALKRSHAALIQSISTPTGKVNIENRINSYLAKLKYDYGRNKNFKIKGKRASIVLYEAINSQDKAILTFLIDKPGQYTTNLFITTKLSGRVLDFAFNRKSIVEKESYLRNQLIEWLSEFEEKIKTNPNRFKSLKNSSLSRYESVSHLTCNLLERLNAGLNL